MILQMLDHWNSSHPPKCNVHVVSVISYTRASAYYMPAVIKAMRCTVCEVLLPYVKGQYV